ncbi:hypothetical protein L3Q82_005661 [Scortum barcoo]|uniref:Uncharacterized protein n=1 Tax=Scortum barcoo TaxID=214431 RepID=A0ACB8V645_9TELE|nr:hypothetical protein L3Q82_005661 [Scortum barcoo]
MPVVASLKTSSKISLLKPHAALLSLHILLKPRVRNVSKEDEATYFCLNGGLYSQSFGKGVFLAVKDRNQQKSVIVKQSPETASVQPGGFSDSPVFTSLQEQRKQRSSVQVNTVCTGSELDQEDFIPGIIYTHRNSSDEEEERSCVYSLSKTIQNSSDTGTYYCAVATCGEILFGEGTTVETRTVCDSGSELDPVVLVLGALLACCVTVIAVLIFSINQRNVCEHCKGEMSVSHHLGHENSTVDQSNDLDGEGKAVIFAALDFSSNVKRRRKEKEYMTECVYSVVGADYHN